MLRSKDFAVFVKELKMNRKCQKEILHMLLLVQSKQEYLGFENRYLVTLTCDLALELEKYEESSLELFLKEVDKMKLEME